MRRKGNRKGVRYSLASFTDAAGKFDPDAIRNGNEDNFYVSEITSQYERGEDTQGDRGDTILLGQNGLLMVVADGMGGMNAGEVASQIAVDYVSEAFSSDSVKCSSWVSEKHRRKFMERVITCADKKIKEIAGKDKSKAGMGSTIMMGWLVEDELTISWCGDSRAYLYNERSGLRLISQDHSYVQELVNKGLLTYEQTFDHPQNNIITRSLGDPSKEIHPESRTVKVGKGDIIMLCSDGLSGVLRDRRSFNERGVAFPYENLEDIISSNTDSMKKCREALWEAASRIGWTDNSTVILCKIEEGPESPWMKSGKLIANGDAKQKEKGSFLRYVPIALLLAVFGIGGFFLGRHSAQTSIPISLPTDSIIQKGNTQLSEIDSSKNIEETETLVEDSRNESKSQEEDKKEANGNATGSSAKTVNVESGNQVPIEPSRERGDNKGNSEETAEQLTPIVPADKVENNDSKATSELSAIPPKNNKIRNNK